MAQRLSGKLADLRTRELPPERIVVTSMIVVSVVLTVVINVVARFLRSG